MDSISTDAMKMLSSGDNLSAISKKVGGDQNAVKSAIGMGLPMIMGPMANTASKPGGADMLTGLMSKLGGSNPADNVSGHLSDPKASGGSDMLSGLMGGQLTTVQNAISNKTRLPPAAVGQVLAMVTPVVMGMVSKKFTQQKMDSKGLTAFLGNESKAAMQSSPDAADLLKQVEGGRVEKAGFMAKLKGLFGG
ncbi:MAG: DUF937 domain-containing protein [Methanomassiliicoccus sp.]|nr:DUF937 domain-containing protein [Methanomassiliicoccus sp.]